MRKTALTPAGRQATRPVWAKCFVITGLLLPLAVPASCLAVSHWPVERPYRFELNGQAVHAGKNVLISFRIIRNDTNEAISNATLSSSSLRSKSAGATENTDKIIALSSPGNKGSYFLAASLPVAGTHDFEFTAAFPGETEPVHGIIEFAVVP